MYSEPVWLSIADAARLLGVTPQAIRKRLKRGTINSRIGNRGQVMVEVANHREPTQEPRQPRTQEPVANPVALVVPWAEHQRIIAEQQARHDADVARRLAERDTLHLDTLGRLQAQAAAERSLWLERIDAAEIRAERVEQRLDQVLDHLLTERRSVLTQDETGDREPWWRRWFGHSTRSKLGGE
jgi:hypothetical protein